VILYQYRSKIVVGKGMEEKLKSRRSQFKDIFTGGMERRKRKASKESDNARKELLESLRGISKTSCLDHRSIRESRQFSKLFMYSDAMISVPADLGTDWYVTLRPEGARCLVILVNNTITLRGKNGAVIEQFVMDPFSVKPSKEAAIFDAIFGTNEMTMRKEIFVTDVITMDGNELIFSDFEFRQYYLEQNFPFTSGGPQIDFASSESPAITLLKPLKATPQTIKELYDGSGKAFESDSLAFNHKSGKYESGLAESSLVFRDSHLSRYSIDTKYVDGFEGDESQEIVLKVLHNKKSKTYQFKTWDGVLVKDCEDVPQWLVDRLAKSVSALARVEIDNSFEFSKISVSKKPFPNSYNRIVDQFRKRRVALNLPLTGLEMLDKLPIGIQDIVSSYFG
jgi:hypothetical protein